MNDSARQSTQAGSIMELLDIMRRLRDPQTGCSWDLQQDFRSIAPYTIEEAYEVADAIENGGPEELLDELGDLLLQVVFHAQMAQEQGWFSFHDVASAIAEKMRRRHPHVFADAAPVGVAAVRESWEQAKSKEREAAGQTSALDGVPRGMAELQRARKLQQRAARVGFDWPDARGVFDKLQEELGELQDELGQELDHGTGQEREFGDPARVQDELGDVLFSAVNLARFLGIDAAASLRQANAKFESRFRHMETAAGGRQQLAMMSLGELERLWQEAKSEDESLE